jgi:hypothetical protein
MHQLSCLSWGALLCDLALHFVTFVRLRYVRALVAGATYQLGLQPHVLPVGPWRIGAWPGA